jgi:hypothetical protein
MAAIRGRTGRVPDKDRVRHAIGAQRIHEMAVGGDVEIRGKRVPRRIEFVADPEIDGPPGVLDPVANGRDVRGANARDDVNQIVVNADTRSQFHFLCTCQGTPSGTVWRPNICKPKATPWGRASTKITAPEGAKQKPFRPFRAWGWGSSFPGRCLGCLMPAASGAETETALADSPVRAYSTVTLLARLRGLSTSHPRATAMW